MKFSHHLLLLLVAAAHATDINIRGPSADDDGTHISPRATSTNRIQTDQEVPVGARELQIRRRGGLFNPPKSAGLFNPPPEDQQQQQQEEDTAITSTTTSTRTSNIFFAARSIDVTTSLVQLAEQSASGYLLAWGPSMTSSTVICQNNECDVTCPEALCEVPRNPSRLNLVGWD